MVVSTCGDARSDGTDVDVCAEAGAVQGSVMFAMVGVFAEQLDCSRRVDGLKYHVGAVNVVHGELGVVSMRTSSS